MKNLFSSGGIKTALALCALILAGLACSANPVTLPAEVLTLVVQDSTPAPAAPLPASLGLGEISMQSGYGVRGSFYEIYFTDPLNPASSMQEGGADKPLVAAINAARISVDVAAYSLSLYSIKYALLDAFNRGVNVRMVMESDNMQDAAPQELLGAGIPIIGDQRNGLMHNKFVVIDRSEVWTGSANFTYTGIYDDNNNLIRIRSTQVANDYTVEFEEMFKDDFFGQDAIAQTPNPRVTIDSVPVEIYFSPDDHVARRIAALLRDAKSSIYFLAYSFTANDFGNIVEQKAKAGLDVAGVMDESQARTNQGTEYDAFKQANLLVYEDGNAGLMHNKIFIIDQRVVIMGSYNFSASAERTNDENVLIFFDEEIARQYLAEFQRVYQQAQR